MFCSQCGTQVADDAAFCGNCGNKLTNPGKEKAATNSALSLTQTNVATTNPKTEPSAISGINYVTVPTTGATVSGTAASASAKLNPKTIGLIAVIAVAAIVVVLTIVTGGFGIAGNSSSDTGSISESNSDFGTTSRSYSDSGLDSDSDYDYGRYSNSTSDSESYSNSNNDSGSYTGTGGSSQTVTSFSAASGLSIDGSSFNKSENMWNFSGTLRNSSSNYTYKDVTVKLTLMNSGMSVGTTTVTLDMRNSTDSLPPNSSTPININVDYSGSVSDLQVDLVSALQISG